MGFGSKSKRYRRKAQRNKPGNNNDGSAGDKRNEERVWKRQITTEAQKSNIKFETYYKEQGILAEKEEYDSFMKAMKTILPA